MISFKLFLLTLLAAPDPISEAAAAWDHLSEAQRTEVVEKLTIVQTEDYIFADDFETHVPPLPPAQYCDETGCYEYNP